MAPRPKQKSPKRPPLPRNPKKGVAHDTDERCKAVDTEPGCEHLFAWRWPLSRTSRANARLQLPPASMHAEVAVPSLDDWEKGWKEKLKAETLKPEMPMLKLLPADFRSAVPPVAQAN
jgi:hypothetical protein